MQRYRLKKDLPMFKAGTVFRLTKKGGLARENYQLCQKHDIAPEVFKEWFEEIEDEICWEDNAIRSELAKVLIAPVDYTEGDKKYFTWDEACVIEKKLDNGWRLPTRSEWALICEEFGQRNGVLNSKVLMDNLKLGMNGIDYFDGDGACSHGNCGYYWSSTPNSSASSAYSLYFNTGTNVYPSINNNRYYGLSVRLVKDLK